MSYRYAGRWIVICGCTLLSGAYGDACIEVRDSGGDSSVEEVTCGELQDVECCSGAWLDETGTCRGPSDGLYPAECCGEQGLCEATSGRWEMASCGHYSCGLPPACAAVIPGCDCGAGRSFHAGSGCAQDPSCPVRCGNQLPPVHCDAEPPACPPGTRPNIDPWSSCWDETCVPCYACYALAPMTSPDNPWCFSSCAGGICLTGQWGSCAADLATCPAVAGEYASLISVNGCACDADCQVLLGQHYGLGVCWEAVNTSVTQSQLDALGMRYIELGCSSGGGYCDELEGNPVTARCLDGVCTLQ